jgi:hypothetical protein
VFSRFFVSGILVGARAGQRSFRKIKTNQKKIRKTQKKQGKRENKTKQRNP